MRIFAVLSIAFLTIAPAAAVPVIVVNGSPGWDCYAQTLREATPLNIREGLRICDQAVSYNLVDDYNRAAALINRSDLRLRSFDYAGVVQDSDSAILLQPQLVVAHLNRGAGLVGLKRHREALETLNRVIAMGYERPELAYYNRALAKEALGDIRGAYADLKLAAQTNPKFELASQELTRYQVIRN